MAVRKEVPAAHAAFPRGRNRRLLEALRLLRASRSIRVPGRGHTRLAANWCTEPPASVGSASCETGGIWGISGILAGWPGSDPIGGAVLVVWEGGVSELASTVGLVTGVSLLARRIGSPWSSPSLASGARGVGRFDFVS